MRKRNELPALDPSRFKVVENSKLTLLYGGGTCRSVTIIAKKGSKKTRTEYEDVED
ncbi:MAG: hypothetical protein QM768_15365 [Agriterribacter sp.]